MKLWFFSPFAEDRNLGRAYNEYMALVPDDSDWVVFQDRDVMFLTPDYANIILDNIRKYPQTGMFTCLTNRVGQKQQLHGGILSKDPNIINHNKIAKDRALRFRTKVNPVNVPISGHVMIVRKRIWDAVGGAPEGQQLLGIDNEISRRIQNKGYKVLILHGLYCFHYYRFDTGIHDKTHLR